MTSYHNVTSSALRGAIAVSLPVLSNERDFDERLRIMVIALRFAVKFVLFTFRNNIFCRTYLKVDDQCV